METTLEKPDRSSNAKLAAISVFFGSVGLLCILLHLSPVAILEKLAAFATHHYFLTGFAFLIISLICLKLYHSRNDEPALRIA
jgi:hypothetical protein